MNRSACSISTLSRVVALLKRVLTGRRAGVIGFALLASLFVSFGAFYTNSSASRKGELLNARSGLNRNNPKAIALSTTPSQAIASLNVPETVVALPPIPISADTGEEPQSKVWFNANGWWAVLPSTSVSPSGTWLWKLGPNNAWTNVLQLSGSTASKADTKVAGNVTHILLHDSASASAELLSVEYVSAANTYQLWSTRPSSTSILLPASETATIDIDSTGRMWLATESGSNLNVYYSDSPYSSFSDPITLDNNINDGDIGVVTALPNSTVGVLWSNQNTKRFGFKIHADGTDPNAWSADETPASQSAIDNVGGGMAGDHLNVAVASDGTLYAVVKTSYITGGYPEIGLLVRHPQASGTGGSWDNLYEVDQSGVRGIILLNEHTGYLRVIYTTADDGGDIVFKETSTSYISFAGARQTLMSGGLNNATSSKQNWGRQVAVLAADSTSARGALITGDASVVGHWKMNEIGGTQTVDVSGLGNNGILRNGASRAAGLPAQGQALALDGADDYAQVPHNLSLSPAAAMTVSAWVKPSKLASQEVIRKGNAYALTLAPSSSGASPKKAYFRFNNDPAKSVASNTDYPTDGNTWMHVAATYDGAAMRIYINGVLENSLAIATAIPTNTTDVTIGGFPTDPTRYFQGQIDEAQIYNRALTASEIQTLVQINHAPSVTAGPNQEVSVNSAASLSGTVSDDGMPNPPGAVTAAWSKVSGPGTVTFSSANNANTTASFSAVGVYVLRLTASDGVLASSSDLTITVYPASTPNGVVGYWKMEESDGPTILDSSPMFNNGTLVNGASRAAGLPAQGQALALDGADDYAQVPHNLSLSPAAAMTVSAWVKPSKLASQEVIRKGNAYALTLAPSSSGASPKKAYFRFNNDPAKSVASNTDYPTDGNTWMHVAATYDGAAMRIYINGVLENSLAIATAIPTNTTDVTIGGFPTDPTRYFQGQIDEAQIYNRALSPAEIEGVVNNLPPVVNAGQDQAILLPATASLSGTVSDDGMPNPPGAVTAAWSKVSGPGTVTFSSANNANTTASFSAVGVYVLRLTASDGVFTSSSELTVTANANLVGHWRMNEGSGTQILDSSGLGNDGLLLGTPAWSGGIDGQALYFDGNTFARVANKDSLNLTNAITLMAWVRPEVYATQDLIKKGELADSAGTGFTLSLSAPDPQTVSPKKVFFRLNNSPTYRLASTSDYPIDGNWMHLAATYDGSTMRLYINGTLESSMAGPSSIGANATDLTIGAQSDATRIFKGLMDEARIYPRALTDAEIQALAQANRPPVVNAGPSQSIIMPADATLNGAAADDGSPNGILNINWSVISGPGTVIFEDATAASTTANFSTEGTYVLRLSASDGVLTSSADLTITVYPASTPNGVVGYWKMEESDGPTILDSSPLVNNGTLVNGASRVPGRPGQGQALALDGADDYAQVPHSLSLSPAAAITVSAWIKPERQTTQEVIRKGNAYALTLATSDGRSSPTPSKIFFRLNNSDNYRVASTSDYPIDGSWMHVAATYDGATMRIYVNGVLENSSPGPAAISSGPADLTIGAYPQDATLNRYYQGQIDEAQVFNRAVSPDEIQAMWHFNRAPDAPGLVAPADAATGTPNSPELKVSVSDADNDNLTVTYYGRPKPPPTVGPDFTIVALPDTQFYSSSLHGGSPAIFNSQTEWIVNNKAARNIVFVTQLGDCVENGDNNGDPVEWNNAWAAISKLEDPATTLLAQGLPYGIAVGNHDQSPTGDPDGTTTFYNQYFGVDHFLPKGYYGGHYGTNNDNHYELFSAGGMDFIVVHLEYDTSANPDVLNWANNLLRTYAKRRAIVVSHYLINTGNPATFGSQGQKTYDALKGNPNLFLMLSAHISGEGQRQDTYNGNTVNTLLADYQGRTNGGNGWLRILEFSPSNNQIRVKTYSPWLNQFEPDANSQFTLSYNMQGGGGNFAVIGTSANAPSGSNATIRWDDLSPNTSYEWYATVSDGRVTTTGPTWQFTTGASPVSFAQNGTASQLVINRPAGAVTNDVMLAGIDVRGTPAITAPPGWTLVRNDVNGSSMRQAVYYHVASGNEPASYTWTFGTSASASGGIVAYSGLDTSSPIDGSSGQANAASTSITAPGVTATVPNTRLVGFFATATNATITKPAAMNNRGQITLTAGSTKVTTEIADVIQTAAGQTGQRIATADKSAENIGQLIALRPQPTAAPQAPATLTANLIEGQVTLNWAVSVGASSYNVYRSTQSGGPYSTTVAQGVTSTSHIDTTAVSGTTYYYVVRAINSTGESPNSPEAGATPACATITLSPTGLPNGKVGVAYTQAITAAGGTSPYTYSVTAGALPASLSLSSGGTVSGTPTQSGSFNFTVTARDAQNCTGSRAYTLVIDCATITLSPTGLPNGKVGVAYTQAITAAGGTSPYTYSVTAGALPPGLTLSPSGVLSGTAKNGAGGKTYNLTVTATDNKGCTGSRAYTLTVNK